MSSIDPYEHLRTELRHAADHMTLPLAVRARRYLTRPLALVIATTMAAGSATAAAGYTALTRDRPAAATATDVRPALDRVARHEPEILTPTSRVIGTTQTGKVVLYRRKNGDTCLALAAYIGTAQSLCKPASQVRVSGLAYGGPVNRFGIVPAGVTTIDFTLTSGARQTVRVVDGFYVAPNEATKGTFTAGGATQTQDFVPRSDAPPIGRSWTDTRGATTTIEPDGTGSLAGPGVTVPEQTPSPKPGTP